MVRAGKSLKAALFIICVMPLLAACAADFQADASTEFGPSSDKAIVVLGTSTSHAQAITWSGESLSTFWQEYDPHSWRLVPKGATIQTKVFKAPFTPFVGSGTGYLDPTVTVLEVKPGHYALVAAGFPHHMTLFVRPNDDDPFVDTYIVDPKKHIDPLASVHPRQNYVFSVEAGEILYIGHFEFVKIRYYDELTGIKYVQDVDAARKALDGFPGIRGEMTVLDLEQPTESAELHP